MKHIFTFFLLTLTACQSPPSCSSISGTYDGTSVMGYTKGTANLEIKVDCSAILHYDQGAFGQATENGRIETKGDGFQFASTSGGGTYEIQCDGNSLVLNGNNWRCELEKN